MQSLYGLDESFFDVVIGNNVIYAVQDVPPCLGEAYRVLEPNGELRISGPHKQSSPNRLFSRIAPLIPPAKRGGRKREANGREVMNKVLYVLETGCQWRALPRAA